MNSNATVLLFGPGATEAPGSDSLRTICGSSKPLDSICSNELRAVIEAVETPLVAFVHRGSHASETAIERLAEAGVSNRDLAAGLAVGGRLADFWLQTTNLLAALIAPPEQAGVLIGPRDAFLGDGLREVNHPIWDWLIRLTAAGRQIEVQTTAGLEPATTVRPTLAPREPSEAREWLRNHIFLTEPEQLVGEIASRADAVAVKSGVFQIHDFLDDSHSASQSAQHEGRHRAADFWHGIMHRREPDYSNAKYWFRHAGEHPIFPELAEAARSILSDCPSSSAGMWLSRLTSDGNWSAFEFVDFCSEVVRSSDAELLAAAEDLQWEEMLLLLESSFEDAVGAG